MYVQKFYCCYCGITKFSDKQFDVSIFPITADVTAAKMTVVWIIKFLEITVLHYSFWSLGHKVGQNNDNKKNNLQKLLCACRNLRFLFQKIRTVSCKSQQEKKRPLLSYLQGRQTNQCHGTDFFLLALNTCFEKPRNYDTLKYLAKKPWSLEMALVDFSCHLAP